MRGRDGLTVTLLGQDWRYSILPKGRRRVRLVEYMPNGTPSRYWCFTSKYAAETALRGWDPIKQDAPQGYYRRSYR